ncbi:MAG: hypothetical protein WAN60_09095, partial [Candidatus Sulfotelmatobacter sp.]
PRRPAAVLKAGFGPQLSGFGSNRGCMRAMAHARATTTEAAPLVAVFDEWVPRTTTSDDLGAGPRLHNHNRGCPTLRDFRRVGTTDDCI